MLVHFGFGRFLRGVVGFGFRDFVAFDCCVCVFAGCFAG